MTDIRDMDAGELREFVAHQLAEVSEDEYDADAVGWGIDRLASISGVGLPRVLRNLADDVETLLEPTYLRTIASFETVGGQYEVRTRSSDGRYDVVSVWAPAGNERVEEDGFPDQASAFSYASARADYDVAEETGDSEGVADAEIRIVAAREAK